MHRALYGLWKGHCGTHALVADCECRHVCHPHECCSWLRDRAGLHSIQKHYCDDLGYQIFLCGSNAKGSIDIWTKVNIASKQLRLSGLFWFVGARSESNGFATNFTALSTQNIPTTIVIDNNDFLHQALLCTNNHPFVILVKLPDRKSAFPDCKSLQAWLSRCVLEFVEAECMRTTYSYRSRL